ncbi:MAG: carcinine hydrolase/isopenicillin-N N-acyltransferase family protein [Promethearchaeota archaeon]
MNRKRVFLIILIVFLWVIGISETGTTPVCACTNFKIKDNQTVFFGNSEDNTYTTISETYITFIPRGQVWYDGSTIEYGSAVVGYANGSAYSWIQGGMNDQGLAFDSTSVPYTQPNLHNERPPLLIPQIFSCITVGDVIESINTHSIYPQEGSVQSFFVDRTGESIIYNIGEDGNLAIFKSNNSFQIATNDYVDDPSRGNPSSDTRERFNVAEEKLNDIVTNDNLTIDAITSVLEAVHFEGGNLNTLYSNIFDVTKGDIYLYFFHQFEEVVKLNLEEELAKGLHSYRIADLFTQTTVDNAYTEYTAYPFLVRAFFADLILLILTGVIDVLLIIGMLFILSKHSLEKVIEIRTAQSYVKEEKSSIKSDFHEISFKRSTVYIIASLALIWSFLSFPMVYWNRLGEMFSLDPFPFPSFYAYYHFFLLISVLGVFLLIYLFSSFTNKGMVIQLVKRGVDLGKASKKSHFTFLILPVVICLLSLILGFLKLVPQVDWLVFIITYPLMAMILLLIPPVAENKSILGKDSQTKWRIIVLKINRLLILVWGFWFLPLFLTVKLDHTYILLLLTVSISTLSFTFYRTQKEFL